MRVLMICPELPSADCPGSMAPAQRQIESLQRLGIQTDIVDMRGIRILKYLQVLPRVRRLSSQIDLIHAHFGYCGWLGRLAQTGRRTKVPLVMSFMGDDLLGTPYNADGDLTRFSQLMVRANRLLAKKAEQVIVKSQEMADVIAPTTAKVIPNGVDIEQFRPMDRAQSRQELGLTQDGYQVLFPGNPQNPRKGHALASRAIAAAESLVGAPIQLVPLWGVAPEQVAVTMNACDAMLMTSLIEGSPNVVKEAMACNLPVVGVPVGDVFELLNGVEGCFRCQRNEQELASSLSGILLSGHRSTGRKAILARGLDLTSVAQRVAAVYALALESRP